MTQVVTKSQALLEYRESSDSGRMTRLQAFTGIQ